MGYNCVAAINLKVNGIESQKLNKDENEFLKKELANLTSRQVLIKKMKSNISFFDGLNYYLSFTTDKNKVSEHPKLGTLFSYKGILGTPEAVTKVLKDCINFNYAFTAISSKNELLGLVGFYHKRSSLMDIKLKKLIKKYGFLSGLYKKIVISILFFKKRDNNKQLLMDGIVVKLKGKGIGTCFIFIQ